MAGLAASLVSQGEASVSLSDIPELQLQRAQQRNAARNSLSATTRVLDWNDCLEPSFEPAAQYDLVLAADCIYYEEHAQALAAALLRHVAPGGTALLANRLGRAGDAVHALMGHLEAAGVRATTEEWAVVNNFSSEPLQLLSFSAPSGDHASRLSSRLRTPVREHEDEQGA